MGSPERVIALDRELRYHSRWSRHMRLPGLSKPALLLVDAGHFQHTSFDLCLVGEPMAYAIGPG